MMTTPTTQPTTPRSTEAGFTLIETSMAMTVVVVGLLSSTSLMFSSVQLDQVNREETTATTVAREVMADLQSSTIDEIWARYNEDGTDDPAGADTAPGKAFEITRTLVGGLVGDAQNAALDLSVEVAFPTDADGDLTERPTESNGKKVGHWLGRRKGEEAQSEVEVDLDGDGTVGSKMQVADVNVLPAQVTVTWTGKTGLRSISFATVLSRSVMNARN